MCTWHRSDASEVMKEMNSETHSWQHSRASFAILPCGPIFHAFIYVSYIHMYISYIFICPADRFFMHLFTFHAYIHFIHLFYCPADRFFVHLFPRKITFHEIFLGFFWKKIFRNFFSAENSNFPRYFWQGKTKYVQAYVMMAAKSLTGYRCGTAALTCSVFFSFGVKGR
jgi:hypothetical protein